MSDSPHSKAYSCIHIPDFYFGYQFSHKIIYHFL